MTICQRHLEHTRPENAQLVRRGDALHLNDTRPLPDEFEFRRVIYAKPPQLTEESAVFTKHLLRKLWRRSVNGAGVSARHSNDVEGGVFYLN